MRLRKNKKGVSVLVGYILLVVFAIIIGAGVYGWLKTYVPNDSLNCPEGTSVFIKDARFDAINSTLDLKVRNNGRFDVAGYFIHATNNSSQQLQAVDLSPYLIEDSQGIIFGNSVLHSTTGGNSLKPDDESHNTFNIPSSIGNIYTIRVIPTRFQLEDNRERFVSCGDARVEQTVGAPVAGCAPSCTGKVCGSDGCGGSCGSCSSGFNCDASGQCISSSCTPAVNPCGTQQCGTATNGTCGTVNCGSLNGLCSSGFTCNATGSCVVLGPVCGNGVIESGEACDDGDTTSGDGCSSTCTTESGWSCVGQPSNCTFGGVSSCPGYCVFLNYSTGSCTSSAGTCQSSGGVYQSGGDQWCTGGPNADSCCCTPTTPPVLQLGYFGLESGTQNWADGGSDSDRSNTRSQVVDNGANGGLWSWHIQDDSSTSYTEQNFNFSGATQIKVSWFAWYESFESGDNDCIRLEIDNGFVRSWGASSSCTGGIVTQNSWIAQSIILNSSQHTFDTSVSVRFEGDMDSDSDEFYIDGINITRLS